MLTERLQQFRRQGYTAYFTLRPDCLCCVAYDLKLPPKGFQADKPFRFEGDTDPADQAILYAIAAVGLDIREQV